MANKKAQAMRDAHALDPFEGPGIARDGQKPTKSGLLARPCLVHNWASKHPEAG